MKKFPEQQLNQIRVNGFFPAPIGQNGHFFLTSQLTYTYNCAKQNIAQYNDQNGTFFQKCYLQIREKTGA
jgi:hypothetical protein